jgi:hypothetical protein
MRRKIFSINRIPKFRSNLNKLVALTSLAFGTACIQIMMSPYPIFAQGTTYNSSGNISSGLGNGDQGGSFPMPILIGLVAFLIGLGFVGWIIYNTRAHKAADQRMEEIYQSLTPELQSEYNEQFRENTSQKEHLNVLLKMRKIANK